MHALAQGIVDTIVLTAFHGYSLTTQPNRSPEVVVGHLEQWLPIEQVLIAIENNVLSGHVEEAHFGSDLAYQITDAGSKSISDRAAQIATDVRFIVSSDYDYPRFFAKAAAGVPRFPDQVLPANAADLRAASKVPEQAALLNEGGFKYDVALSFAGAQRDYVAAVAESLQLRDIKVFYDDFEKAHLWGKDGAEEFEKVYSESARHAVIFASKAYVSGPWTNHERRSALSRQVRDRGDYILLVRFDDSKLPGISDTLLYQDARQIKPAQLASLIIKKLLE